MVQRVGGTNSGWSSRRSQLPSGWRRTTCARAPAPSFGGVEVRAMSPLIRVGSGCSGSKWGAVGQHLLPQRADGVPAHRLAARRVGHDRVLLVERGDSGRVTGVGPLDEQAGEVFGPHGLLVLRHGIPPSDRASMPPSLVARRPEVQQMVLLGTRISSYGTEAAGVLRRGRRGGATSPGRPSGCTSASPASAPRSASSNASSAPSCSTGRPAPPPSPSRARPRSNTPAPRSPPPRRSARRSTR